MSSLLSPLREMSWSAIRGGGSPNVQLMLVELEWISDEDVVWDLETFFTEDPRIQHANIKYWLLKGRTLLLLLNTTQNYFALKPLPAFHSQPFKEFLMEC